MSFKSYIKKNKLFVDIYENCMALVYYIKACKNATRSKRRLTDYDRKEIQKYKNIHKGKRCFIVGTGPSQNVKDLNLLKDEITIAVNNAYKSYDSTEWRADYYVVMDDNAEKLLDNLFMEGSEYKGVFIHNGLQYKGKHCIKMADDAAHTLLLRTFWHRWFPRIFPIMRFSDDLSKVIYTGKTVVLACIQIAAYMGFDEIYLSGIDCDYHGMLHSSIMGGNEEEKKRERLLKSGELMMEQFEALSEILPEYGIKVYNATRGGRLEVFPRVDLDLLFKEKAK